jgi:hypothetical protein
MPRYSRVSYHQKRPRTHTTRKVTPARAYGGINVHKKQRQMCFLTEAAACLPQRIPMPRRQYAAVCAARLTARGMRKASTKSAWVARKCIRPLHWCWTGAVAWGRVALLGWLQGDGRETGGCGRLGGRPEDPGSSPFRARPRARTGEGATTLATHGTALPARRVPRQATSGRTDATVARDVVELLDKPRGKDVTYGGRVRTVLATGTVAGARPRPSLRPGRSGELQQAHTM